MHDVPRRATVVAASDDVRLLCIARRALVDLLRAHATAASPESQRLKWRSYETLTHGLLERLGTEIAAARTRGEYMAIASRHRSSVAIIPLESTLLGTGRDYSRRQAELDLRREAAVVVDGASYATSRDFAPFLAALEALAEAAVRAPPRAPGDLDHANLPPSLVGFLPLLFSGGGGGDDDDDDRPAAGAAADAAADADAAAAVLLHLLTAASRTTSGGESFAQCHRLFANGDAVVLTPFPELTSPTRIRAVRPGLVTLTSSNVYRVQHRADAPAARGTGYETWCLLNTNVVEILDFRSDPKAQAGEGSTRHMSIDFFPPAAEAALRAVASDA